MQFRWRQFATIAYLLEEVRLLIIHAMNCSRFTNHHFQTSRTIVHHQTCGSLRNIAHAHHKLPTFLNSTHKSIAFCCHAVVTSRSHIICAATAVAPFTESNPVPVTGNDGSATQFPPTSGLYAVYDKDGILQFVGVSRKINISISTHIEALPELVHSIKVLEIPDSSKEDLTEAWKQWIQEAGMLY